MKISNDNDASDNNHHDVNYINNNIKDDDDNVDSISNYDRDDTNNNVNGDDLTMIAQISLHISMERF